MKRMDSRWDTRKNTLYSQWPCKFVLLCIVGFRIAGANRIVISSQYGAVLEFLPHRSFEEPKGVHLVFMINVLKVVANEKRGGREASYCKNIVSDRGDRCLFNFLCDRRLFFNVFPFPVYNAKLIGDWLENRRSAPNCSVRLFLFFHTLWHEKCAKTSVGRLAYSES